MGNFVCGWVELAHSATCAKAGSHDGAPLRAAASILRVGVSMRCPKCRKAIAFDAMSHECGWRVSSHTNGARPEPEVRTVTPGSKLLAEEMMGRLRKLTGARPYREIVQDRSTGYVPPEVPMLRDVGHGPRCTCEVCWGLRFARPGEKRQDTQEVATGVSGGLQSEQ